MIKEKLLSSINNANGTVSKVYTSHNYNLAYIAVVLLFGWLIVASASEGRTSLQLCQESYIKSTNEIVRYNEDNPDYKVKLPVYNCTETLPQMNASGSKVPPPSELTLRDRFWLGNCRFINDFHRLGKYNLEWKAYDIACEMGKSFDIRSPWEYKLSYKGYWTNLWNYIILEKVSDNNIKIVLAHIVNNDEQNTKYWYNDVVGTTDISWASTNYHVHIELWDGWMNVTREFALSRDYQSINWTALLNHRKWNFGQPKVAYYFTHYDLWDVKQNDTTPCIGASGKDLCYLEKSGVRTMALTSDIRKEVGVKFGDQVKLIWDVGCEGIFQVEDEMNIRFRKNNILRPWTPYAIKWDLPSMDWGACSIIKL